MVTKDSDHAYDTEEITNSKILFYQTKDGKNRIEVRLEEGSVWLSQTLLAELFQTSVPNINLHIRNIYEEGELEQGTTIKDYLIIQNEGKRKVKRTVKLYNLDMILAIGYRVRSHRGVQFRKWATERLKEYVIKGFILDDERLSEPGGIDYFDELLDRIRAIRASEKRFYQKVRDIYLLSADYDPKHPLTQEFFATVQNKLLYAVTGKTAAEIIHDRADSAKPNMGLTIWKGAGRERVLTKQDTEIAKNYLCREEIETLELLIGQFLDFAELQAKRKKMMYMTDWKDKLDGFLRFNEQDILVNAGKISAEVAKELAHSEFERFSTNRRALEANLADEELLKVVKNLTLDES